MENITNWINSGSTAVDRPQVVIPSDIVDNMILQYYTIIYCPERMEGCWRATGILETSVAEAMKRFASYSNVHKFHVVRIDLRANAS